MARTARAVRLSGLIVVALLVVGCATTPTRGGAARSSLKILVMPREGSADIELMVTRELGVMISMLKDAGLTPVVGSPSGNPFRGRTGTVNSDLKLAEVRVADYAGFLMPCMAVEPLAPIPPEAVRIVTEAAAAGKPIAAQRNSMYVLSKAGLLKGRKYAFLAPVFTEGIYVGTGVVQDGNIITSAMSPKYESSAFPSGTEELTRMLIQSLPGSAR